MSEPYRSELCHALDSSRITSNRTTVGASDPSTNDSQSKKNACDLMDEEEPCDEVCDVNHSCRATVPCQWIDKNTSMACVAGVSCKTIPAHFRDTHGIRGIEWRMKIYCWWRGCDKWVSRKNFARHIREAHLNHPRSKKEPC